MCSLASFPKRLYTLDEIKEAERLIKNGHKHRLKVIGSPEFKQKVKESLKLVKTAGYYDYLRTYIKAIVEVEGFTQLRESEGVIWANKYAVANAVDSASLFIQKANHMKEYIEGRLYYGGDAERRSIDKRIEFLESLMMKSRNREVRKECEKLLKSWSESVYL